MSAALTPPGEPFEHVPSNVDCWIWAFRAWLPGRVARLSPKQTKSDKVTVTFEHPTRGEMTRRVDWWNYDLLRARPEDVAS